MTSPPQFRRVILGLGSGQVDEALLAPSAEFANLLGASIQGVFVEDETLAELADFLRIREFDSLSHEWRPLDAARTADEVQLMMRSAKRRSI